jgi:hypothetical protein
MTETERMHQYLHWFIDRILETPGIEDLQIADPNMTLREWVTRYSIWAISKGLFHVFGDVDGPFAGIICRPILLENLHTYELDFYGHLYDFDEGGDVVAVDFAYFPGKYLLLRDFVQTLGTRWIAWFHAKRHKFRLFEVADLPRVNPMKGTHGQIRRR